VKVGNRLLIVGTAAAILLLSGAALEPAPIEQLYATKATWEHMNWAAAGKSPVWTAPGWQPYVEDASIAAEQAKLDAKYGVAKGPSEKWVSNRRISLFGRMLQANLAYREQSNGLEHFTSVSSDALVLSRDDCDKLFLSTAAKFGKPLIDDGSYLVRFGEEPDTHVQTVIIKQQWDVGPTRITANCYGILSGTADASAMARAFTWNIVFSATNATPAVVPKFALRCTRQMRDKMATAPRELGEMAFWVDLNTNMVTGPTHESLGDPGSFKATGTTISFNQTTPAVIIKYEIDRLTGALSGNYFQRDVWFGTISGQCEKHESLEPKF
jgi:hypothetical protein